DHPGLQRLQAQPPGASPGSLRPCRLAVQDPTPQLGKAREHTTTSRRRATVVTGWNRSVMSKDRQLPRNQGDQTCAPRHSRRAAVHASGAGGFPGAVAPRVTARFAARTGRAAWLEVSVPEPWTEAGSGPQRSSSTPAGPHEEGGEARPEFSS